MQTINIAFSDKEMEIIALMAPPKTAEEVINLVLKDWFSTNAERLYNTIKTKEQKYDEIIAVSVAKAQALDTGVLK